MDDFNGIVLKGRKAGIIDRPVLKEPTSSTTSTQIAIVQDQIQLSPHDSFQFFQQSVLLATVMVPVVGPKTVSGGIWYWLISSVYSYFNIKEAALENAMMEWQFEHEGLWQNFNREYGITPAHTFYAQMVKSEIDRISASGPVDLWIDDNFEHWADTSQYSGNVKEFWENGMKALQLLKDAPEPPNYIPQNVINEAIQSSRNRRWMSLGLFFLIIFLWRRRKKDE